MGKYFQDDDAGAKLAYDASFVGVVPGEKRGFRDSGCALFLLLCLSGLLCLTAVMYNNADSTLLLNHTGAFDDDLRHFSDEKNLIIAGVGITVVLAYLWLQLLQHCTKPLVYGSLFLAVAGAVGAGIMIISKKMAGTEALGIVFICFGALLAVAVCFFRRRITFSCELIGHAAAGVRANSGLFIVLTPLFFITTGAYLLWCTQALWFTMTQSKDVVCGNLKVQAACTSVGCTWEESTGCSGTGAELDVSRRWAAIYVVFMLLWGCYFLAGTAKVVISGTIAQWYFARDKSDRGFFAFWSMLKWALTYHLGSIAKGSALLAVVKMAEMALQAAEKEATNAFQKFFLCLIRCFVSCIAALVRWITKYAYVYIAMHGQPFMEASRNVRKLFLRSRFCTLFTTDLIVNLIVHVGMFACVGAVVFGSAAYMKSHNTDTYSVTALALLAMFSCVTFWTVGQVVETATCAVLVCYMEDDERHGTMRDFRGEDTYYAIHKSASAHGGDAGGRGGGGASYGTVM